MRTSSYTPYRVHLLRKPHPMPSIPEHPPGAPPRPNIPPHNRCRPRSQRASFICINPLATATAYRIAGPASFFATSSKMLFFRRAYVSCTDLQDRTAARRVGKSGRTQRRRSRTSSGRFSSVEAITFVSCVSFKTNLKIAFAEGLSESSHRRSESCDRRAATLVCLTRKVFGNHHPHSNPPLSSFGK